MISTPARLALFALSTLLANGAAPTTPPANGSTPKSFPAKLQPFIETHCADCHDDDEKKGDLDLTSLTFAPSDPKNFATWVKVFDRASAGEMPPKKRERPPPVELRDFVSSLSAALTSAEDARVAREGRATQRRLNRYEYENALRDLLGAPWLQVKDTLPEDGEAFRFNKVGDALDISHVQMARYLAAADSALRQVVAFQPARPETTTKRYYARDQRSFTNPMKFSFFNSSPERATFPTLDGHGQPELRVENAPAAAASSDPIQRELEGVGVVASAYEPIEPKFQQFKAPASARYKIRLNVQAVWVGPTKAAPGKQDRWWIPELNDVSPGRRAEPMTLYSERPPWQMRYLGKFDVTPEATAHELDVFLVQGETIRPDAARLFRSRPGAARFQNPLAERDGQPGVSYRWLEVEGPLYDQWPTAGHQLLFGDLPLKKTAKPGPGKLAVEVEPSDPAKDAPRLLRNFVEHAYRRPVSETEAVRYLPVIETALKAGSNFTEAMLAGYTAVLSSPGFLCLEEKPGRLDDFALAARLSFFLWNSVPDAELRTLAGRGELHQPKTLRAQTERMLNDPKSRQFVDAFLDYWLDLRKIVSTAPDSTLYGDYYLDDLLQESALEETRAFFATLVRENLPARNIVASDFALVNERLATHYGLAPVDGVALRRVPLPPDSVRGGIMTQAAVLKVTANGTTTSPVIRGAWIMERILGQPPPPPPPSVPAVEPDIRGATTIRQLLDQHRTQPSCNACHAKIDPAGFALESFDVMGGWRDRYRATAEGGPAEKGIGHGGQKVLHHFAQPVDCSGELWDGRKFSDVRELKRLLLTDERQVARNLAKQLVVYATGAPVSFGDRAKVEAILKRTESSHYGVRALVHEIIGSELFLNK
jgi:hypothetical protein